MSFQIRSIFAVLALGITLLSGAAIAEDTAHGMDEDAIRTIVRDYLRENPEVIIEALQEYERRENERQSADQIAAIRQLTPVMENDPASPDNGVVDGDVTLVEFFDYQCSYCKKIFPSIEDIMEDDPNLRVVFKEYPILGPESVLAARVALAARKQGKYMVFHTAMMELRGTLTEAIIMQTALEVGIDPTRLSADMRDPAIQEHLDRNRQIADAIGVRGTPALVIGEQLIPGAIEKSALVKLIEQVRGNSS